MSKKKNIWPLIFKGIENQRWAFCGPHTVQIDLTDRCNNTCLGCWVHSPLLDKKEVFPEGEKELSFELVKDLIDELAHLRTQEIFLAGSGEPFLYPRIKEVIKLIKSQGIYLNIITNGTLINSDMALYLVENNVDLVTLSIWSGTPQGYVSTHPGKTEEEFFRLKENFKILASYKKRFNPLFPHVKVYVVLCSKNYDELEEMIDFAKEIDADSIEFQTIDIIEGKTDSLNLTSSMIEKIIEQFDRIRNRKDVFSELQCKSLMEFVYSEKLPLGKLWKNYKEGFKIQDECHSLNCKRGRELREREVISEDINVFGHPKIFWYRFKSDECKTCQDATSCLDDGWVDVKFMNINDIGRVINKLLVLYSKDNNIIYNQDIVTSPCYIGWYYARILTNGNVIPCCKAAKHPLGNLYEHSFSYIWNSAEYREFRFKAKNFPKTDKYFSKIDCVKGCDNWGMNSEIEERLKLNNKIIQDCSLKEKARRKGVVILAKNFFEGDLNPYKHHFGKDVVISGKKKGAYALYEFSIDKDGRYELWSRYTSRESRPVDIYVDGKMIKKGGMNHVTGSWDAYYLKVFKETELELNKGRHILEIKCSHLIPHIESFMFIKKENLPTKEKISYIKILKSNISHLGFKKTIFKFARKLTPKNIKDRYLEILGILDGEYAYKGPFHVQIDLTNNCNNTCIACWCNSPLLKERRLSEEEKRIHLPLFLVKEVLDELSSMGVVEIYYSGSGEPFMHPDIMEILEYTKRKGFVCHVNTNFTLLDKGKLGRLIDIGVDFLTVSLWSATAETYVRTHPNRTKEDFQRIKDNLIYLNTHKEKVPYIKLYNVIFNMNYHEVEKMVDFAHETKSESVEFTLVDTIPGATDVLALDEEQLNTLKRSCEKIKSRLDYNNRVRESGVVVFQFDQFLRRISSSADVKEAKYDRNIIDSMPCYIGWLFARIIPNGEVHSCLKAHRIPTGSLYKDRFFEIWNSKKQIFFRKKTLVYKKSDPFFRLIGNDPHTKEAGCYKSCDDIGRNMWMHNKMKMLTIPEKILLKALVNVLKMAKNIKRRMRKKGYYKTFHKDPLIAGILHGRKAFVGPEQVVVDPTNRCNLRCISCWLYSPLLTKDKPSSSWLNKELSKDVLKKLIDDLSSLGTKRIRFTGGGEPFMHKDLMEIIEYAVKKKLLVAITTNFGLVSKEDIKKLVDLGIEELCVSVWASNSEIYKKTHPGTSSLYFERIKENLAYLKEVKKTKPRVTLAHVIMNVNVDDFERMYEFAREYKVDALYFTLVDVFDDQTDKLILNEEDRKRLLIKTEMIRRRAGSDGIQLEFFNGFVRRLSQIKEEFSKGEYDKFMIDRIPCYAGWIFSRILADGSVCPCCRGVKKIMGNINKTSFKDIWFSPQYDEFRARAKYLPKSDSYFKDIGCTKECDNFMHNEEIYRRLRKLREEGGDGCL